MRSRHSLSRLGEIVVTPTDLVEALCARGYPSEVVRAGTGLKSREWKNVNSEEPRCGLGGFTFRSIIFCCAKRAPFFLRGDSADGLAEVVVDGGDWSAICVCVVAPASFSPAREHPL